MWTQQGLQGPGQLPILPRLPVLCHKLGEVNASASQLNGTSGLCAICHILQVDVEHTAFIAELITTYIDVEPVAFDRNHYCIDLTFYYRILADAIVTGNRPTTLQGLAVFSKRAVLCGEDSRAHIYRSNTRLGRFDGPSTLFANLPTAIVETADTKQPGRMPAAGRFLFTIT